MAGFFPNEQTTLFCDGGMGTQLIAAGLTTNDAAILWNLEKPDVIRQIHQAYADAGCQTITTNTFQGTRTALAMHNASDRVVEVNAAATRIAREVADQQPQGSRPWVLADIGPFGGFLEPMGETTPEELLEIFTEPLAAMYEAGADSAVIETMSDPAEVVIAIQAAKKLDASKPVMSTYAFEKQQDGSFRTMMGVTVEQALKQAIDAGADLVGANCGTSLSLDDYIKLAGEMVAAAGATPVVLQPNAGTPKQVDGQWVHPATPEDMAKYVKRWLDTGLRALGGCCGTTPAHLKAMIEAGKV